MLRNRMSALSFGCGSVDPLGGIVLAPSAPSPELEDLMKQRERVSGRLRTGAAPAHGGDDPFNVV
jgi:hypothetical protein